MLYVERKQNTEIFREIRIVLLESENKHLIGVEYYPF